MQASTAPRERLVSPLSLAVMAGLFGAAFLMLKPDQMPGLTALNESEQATSPAPVIDQLGLAYLRAERARGQIDDASLVAAIERLGMADRHADAQALLDEYPELPVPLTVRSRLDLERAALGDDGELLATVRGLIDNGALSDEAVLQRAMALVRRLPDVAVQQDILTAWAEQAGSRAQQFERYLDCARQLQAASEASMAMDCLELAEGVAETATQRFDSGLTRMTLLAAGSKAHRAEIDRLSSFKPIEDEALERFAGLLLEQNRPDMAYRMYARLALQQPARAHHWLPLASRWANAAGRPEEAVVFLQAYAETTPAHLLDDEHRQRVRQDVEALQLAAGQTRAAFDSVRSRLADRSANEAGRAATLAHAIDLARQLGEMPQALAWNSELLRLDPTDADTAELQRDLAMATGDLPLALSWARRLVERFPHSLKQRKQLARIAEWSGQPEEALAHWVWLAGRAQGAGEAMTTTPPTAVVDSSEPSMGAAKSASSSVVGTPENAEHALRAGNVEALEQVVRLARMTLRSGLAADSLRELARLQAPSERQVVQLMQLYDQEGENETAADALQEIIALHGPTRFTLRTLAAHEKYHNRRERSLAAWQRQVSHFGRDVEATLAQTELLWRLDRKSEASAMSDHLQGQTLLSSATDYQIRLLAEIGWRYRKPWLTLLVRPRLQSLDEKDQRSFFGRRSLDVLVQTGQEERAMEDALQLWDNTGDPDFALAAMELALKNGRSDIWHRFSPDTEDGARLATLPRYWAELAQYRLQNQDVTTAVQAFDKALALDPAHLESISGLIWTAIGQQNESRLMQLLPRYRELAEATPSLWQAMAIGYLQLGAATVSLHWFDLLLDDIDTDYAMLLTYADALEYAGRSATALKVRQYTLHRLRPLLVQGSEAEQDLLLRQYTRLSSRYAGAESNAALFDRLLARPESASARASASDAEPLWREDMAISWLMATQQHEQARIIMADLHAERMQSPVWQRLALALKDEDEVAVQAIVQASGPLSVGNHILALRQLGNDRDAYVLAQRVLRPGTSGMGSSIDDLQVAREQYVALRDAHPSFLSGAYHSRSAGALDIDQRGVRVRHSLPAHGLGLALDMQQRQLDSSRFRLTGSDQQDDVALSLFFGGNRVGGRVTTGFLRTGEHELVYGSAAFVQALRAREARVSAELAYNEATELSPELIVGARQHRLSLAYDTDLGRREFLRLQADATEINTRVEEHRVARGLGGSIELGMRGSFGSNQWSTSVRAAHLEHDRETGLPRELRLAPDSTMDAVVAPEIQSLSLGASLSRGGINADFPQVSTPRYFLSASVGQNWPDRIVGFQLGAGAGIRVFGGDELSFSVQHDTQSTTRRSGDDTALGVNYRYHFQ